MESGANAGGNDRTSSNPTSRKKGALGSVRKGDLLLMCVFNHECIAMLLARVKNVVDVAVYPLQNSS